MSANGTLRLVKKEEADPVASASWLAASSLRLKVSRCVEVSRRLCIDIDMSLVFTGANNLMMGW